jgi:hypothetical protein
MMEKEIKKKIEDIIVKVAEGKLSKKSAVEQIIHFMENYADRSVVAYLELEKDE